jgi:ribosomal protein S18 acetylase RimI-like enzyme
VGVSEHTARWTATGSVTAVTVEIRPAEHVDDELIAALAGLIPQLSSSSPPPTASEIQAIVDSPDTVLFLARIDGRIVGSLTLAFYRIPTGLKAWIEDVVVDGSARGAGVGVALNQTALAEARDRGAKNVSLTSRPTREVANRLYQRIGFEPRETNVYRYTL